MVFLIMGSVLPGYMFRYQYCLVLLGALFAGATICRVRSWMSAWVFLLLGGMDSIAGGKVGKLVCTAIHH